MYKSFYIVTLLFIFIITGCKHMQEGKLNLQEYNKLDAELCSTIDSEDIEVVKATILKRIELCKQVDDMYFRAEGPHNTDYALLSILEDFQGNDDLSHLYYIKSAYWYAKNFERSGKKIDYIANKSKRFDKNICYEMALKLVSNRGGIWAKVEKKYK